MTDKITINFQAEDPIVDMDNKKQFSVRHLRNYEKNKNGGIEFSQMGGYTVLGDDSGELYVSKCNPTSDKFSRKEGLFQCLDKYIWRSSKCRFKLDKLHSVAANEFVALVKDA